MADSKITKKPSGSLAMRILGISVLLLVIPLLLQTFFLYRQEYQQKLGDVKEDLKMLVQERTHYIEEIIHMNWRLLDSWDVNQTIGYRGSVIEKIPTPQGVKYHFLVISLSRSALLIGKQVYGNESLVIPLPFSVIGTDMPRMYPIHISLISNKGRVLWENYLDHNQEAIEVTDTILGTDFSIRLKVRTEDVKGLHLRSYYFRFLTLVLFVGVLGGGLVYLLARRIAKPLNRLIQTMNRVSEGAVHARYTPDKMGFEINSLGIRFNETLDNLLKHAAEAENQRIQREKLAKEFHIGHEIQANLLPKHIPGLKGIDLASRYFASKEVNGDFYDLFQLENGHLLIAVCDIAGKGIQACLFSLGLRSLIRSVASMKADLSEILIRVNDLYLMDAHESAMFATLWIGIFDPKTKVLRYASQGHPPAYLARKGSVQDLWTQGIALGAQTLDVINTEKVKLKKGDTLVLYTDGIIEAHNKDNQLYGKQRLITQIEKQEPETAEQFADRLIEDVHLFVGGAMQHDDMTLLVFKL